MERKLIKKVLVNQADMVAAGESREVAVFGDVGAEFNINIIKINDSSKESYYNFKTDTWARCNRITRTADSESTREISNFKKSAEIIERIIIIFRIIGAAAAVLNLPEAFKIPLINAANDINRM